MTTQNHEVNVNVKANGADESTTKLKKTEDAANKTSKSFKELSSKAEDLGGNLKDLGSGSVPQAANAIKNLTSGMGLALGATVALTAASVAVVATLESLGSQAREAARAADQMADRMGVSMQQLAVLDLITKENGGSVQQLQAAYDKLSVALTNVQNNNIDTINSLRALGIEQSDIAGKSETEVAGMIIKNYDALGRSAEATAAVMKIFGESFREQLPAIRAAAFETEEYNKRVLDFGAVATPAMVQAGKDQKKAAEDLQLAIQGLGNEFGVSFGGMKTDVTEWGATTINSLRGVLKEMRKSEEDLNWFEKAFRRSFSLVMPGAGMIARATVLRPEAAVDDGSSNAAETARFARSGPGGTAAVKALPPLPKNPPSGTAKVDPVKAFLEQQMKSIQLFDVQTEQEKVLYEIRNGSLKSAGDAEQKRLLANAKELDFLKFNKKAGEDQVKRDEKRTDELKKQDEVLQRQLGKIAGIGSGATDSVSFESRTIGMGSVDKETVAALDKIAAAANEARKAVEGYAEGLNKVNEAEQKAIAEARAAGEERKRINIDWSVGARNAFAQYLDDAANVSKQSEQLFGTAFQGMEDALVNFTMTGKLNFADLARSVIADIVRMQARAAISGILGMIGGAFGGAFGGAAGGATSSLYSLGSGGSSLGLKLADGGVVNRATSFMQADGTPTMMGEAGPEAVLPLKRGSNGKLGVQMQGGGGGGVSIGSISIVVQGGNTNEETGAALRKELTETMKQIADGRIANARRSGGLLAA